MDAACIFAVRTAMDAAAEIVAVRATAALSEADVEASKLAALVNAA